MTNILTINIYLIICYNLIDIFSAQITMYDNLNYCRYTK